VATLADDLAVIPDTLVTRGRCVFLGTEIKNLVTLLAHVLVVDVGKIIHARPVKVQDKALIDVKSELDELRLYGDLLAPAETFIAADNVIERCRMAVDVECVLADGRRCHVENLTTSCLR
jgi:hypothetical protein